MSCLQPTGVPDTSFKLSSNTLTSRSVPGLTPPLPPNPQVCPFRDDLFISCGGDWTVRLWQEGRATPLLTFQTANEEVHDVQWAASDAVVFGAATAAGQLEVGAGCGWLVACLARALRSSTPVAWHSEACLLSAAPC